jgi:hypothetical protein
MSTRIPDPAAAMRKAPRQALSQRDGMAAQVLSSAMEGVIHNAARRGMLTRPKLKRELVSLLRRYLEPDLSAPPPTRRQANGKARPPQAHARA